MKQLYICLEGIDGVGKSTLANMLEVYLRESGYSIEMLRSTKAAPPGDFIEKVFAKYPCLHKSRFLRFFLFAHRSNHAASMIRADSELIIGDRSIITSYAYRWTKYSIINKIHIALINWFESGLPSPDYIIYCHADYTRIAERLSSRTHCDIDENEKRAAWLVKVYEEIMSDKSIGRLKLTKYMYLDCNGKPDDIFASLTAMVDKIIEDNKE